MSDLPVMQWLTNPPERLIQNVLLTLVNDKNERYMRMGWVDQDGAMLNAVAYMIVPHFLDVPEIWKSEYKGDKFPSENGMYLCCDDYNSRINRNLHVHMYWFDAKKSTFGGSSDMIAYMDMPKPY